MAGQLRTSPEAFFKAFLEVGSEQGQSLDQSWPKSKDLTKLMLLEIFPRIAAKLGLRCYGRDYYTLDCIFYVENDTKHFRSDTTYAKYIAVAIEHENDAGTTAEEMNKLQLFSTPLRVLITYPWSATHASKLLERYAGIIRESDIFSDVTTLRRQLVIFGYRAEAPYWQAFAFSEGSWQPLQAADNAAPLPRASEVVE
jgi:hypothetical protein